MAGRSRKMTVVSTGKIGKQATASRAEQEKKIKLDRKALAPPAWLDEDAAAEVQLKTQDGVVHTLRRGEVEK